MAFIIGYRLPSGEEIPLEQAVREGLVDEDGCPFDDATDVLTDEAPGGLLRPLVNEAGGVYGAVGGGRLDGKPFKASEFFEGK
jgi:hypothetical protein